MPYQEPVQQSSVGDAGFDKKSPDCALVWMCGPVRGICHAYGHALQTLAKHQTLGDSMGFGEELIRQRLQAG